MEDFFEASLFSKPFLSAVVVAAGSSVRMGGKDKIFLPIAGIPVVARSLLAYENCEDVSEIVVVTKESSMEEIKKLKQLFSSKQLDDDDKKELLTMFVANKVNNSKKDYDSMFSNK